MLALQHGSQLMKVVWTQNSNNNDKESAEIGNTGLVSLAAH